ncbi:MAG TPA: response regulator [Usitatibacter sp.]|jgi:CheY-like chemotaxis protein|nr:response regulator [Usitatibacter sp.]
MRPPQIIVADQPDSANSLVAMLISEGFSARAAYEGRHAIELSSEMRPEAVISDLSLPNGSGLELARALRTRFGPSIRLVAYTGWTAARDRDRAMKAGFDSYVLKPADAPTIVDALSPETLALFTRASLASEHRIELLLDLAESLVTYRGNLPVGAKKTDAAVRRMFVVIRAALDRNPISSRARHVMMARLGKLTGVDQEGPSP